MTTVVVVARRPDEDTLPTDVGADILSPSEATALYRASLLDVCETIQHGEAELLVNYPDPAGFDDSVDPERELRDLLDGELPDADAVRYEVQVGGSYSGRVGNALTHLLESEAEASAAVVDPTVPLLRREHIGRVAMKLRTSEVVLGPALNGGIYFAGFTDAVDFEDAFAEPAIGTTTDRARNADLAVEYLPLLPRVDTQVGLATTVSLLRARLSADRIVPPRTGALIRDWGLAVDGSGALKRETAET